MNKVNYKYLIFVFVVTGLLFSFQSKVCKNNNNDLEKTIIQVVKAFKEKDTKTLNKLISKEKGLIVLFKRGAFNEYSKTDKIDFDNPAPEYPPYFDFSTDYKLTFNILPTFSCDTMKWSKNGLFCDTTTIDNLLSTTAQNLKKYREDNISESEIKAFEELEESSRRIVLSDNEGGELIFYLTFINGKWHLTILDRLSSDCSA